MKLTRRDVAAMRLAYEVCRASSGLSAVLGARDVLTWTDCDPYIPPHIPVPRKPHQVGAPIHASPEEWAAYHDELRVTRVRLALLLRAMLREAPLTWNDMPYTTRSCRLCRGEPIVGGHGLIDGAPTHHTCYPGEEWKRPRPALWETAKPHEVPR